MKRLIAAAAVLAITAPVAFAASTHYLKVSPTTVKRGHSVTFSGSAGSLCSAFSRVSVYSKALATPGFSRTFHGVPAIIILVRNHTGAFGPIADPIDRSVKKGTYHVGANCNGKDVGSATLNVK